MRQFLNWEKKRLEGWSAQMTHLPMASASAVVVATTSEVEGLMNTWGPGGTGWGGGMLSGVLQGSARGTVQLGGRMLGEPLQPHSSH